MSNIAKVGRRSFLKICPMAGAGLVLGYYLSPSGSAAKAQVASASPESFAPNAFLSIDTDGQVTIWSAKSEMGQGVRTSLPMIVAEELEADWSKVLIRQADLDRKYGSQLTGGSTSVRTSWDPLRKAGATAREMLIAAAAQKWNVAPADCRAEKGTVIHVASGRRASYGELAAAAAKLPVPKEVQLKDPKDFRIVGTPVPRADTPAKVDGSAVFGLDVKVPGMLYAVIARCPVFGGQVESFDATKAKAVAGVRHVVEIKKIDLPHPFTGRSGGPGNSHHAPGGVAVVAESTWAAMEGRQALEIKWNEGPQPGESTVSLRETFQKLVQNPGKVMGKQGEVEQALTQAAKKVEAEYEVPFLAHAPMEPVNCTAQVTETGCEIWGPTQVPGAAQTSIAQVLKLPPESIKVHVTFLGGGFGRRLNQDYAVEAALVSKAVGGAPVKVVWTREDDIQRDYYRPASYHRLTAGLDAQGQLIAWLHRMASTSVGAFYQGPSITNPESTEISAQEFPAYAVPNFQLEYALAHSVVPRGWYRSVENSGNAFIIQGFLDEVAAAGGQDPVALRLKMLGESRTVNGVNTGRLKAVIELAAAKAGWGTPLPKGRGRGIAAHYCFRGYVAQVVEASVAADGKVNVHRVVCAVDCGTVINPDTVKAQMEGSVAFGLTAALYGEITLENGRVKQSNFHDYPMLRINQMPVVEVHIVPSTEPPGGVGEPGVPPVAPALANAIFAATGKRIRRLPIRPADLKKA